MGYLLIVAVALMANGHPVPQIVEATKHKTMDLCEKRATELTNKFPQATWLCISKE
jgi:hypothetical protein